jgi:hypothetical protein
MTHHEQTIASILRRLANEYDGPVDERRVLERVLEQRPSSAKNPFATIRERLRWDGLSLGWLRLGRGRLMPLRIAIAGLRFRCVPRPLDHAAGLLPLAHLLPFCSTRSLTCALRDSDGNALAFVPVDDDAPHSSGMPAFDLHAWYTRVGFCDGDSILVTVSSAEPLVLSIEHEPQAAFRSAAVAAQDAELIEAIVERAQRSHAALILCDEVILPIFATAAWRTAYPGSPWQQLVIRDGRLHLVDDIFLTSQPLGSLQLFGSAEVFEPTPRSADADEVRDRALLAEIEALQRELRRVRQVDAEAGLWSGQVQRASATFSTLDEADAVRRAIFGSLDDRLGEGGWDLDEDWEPDEDFDQPDGVVVDQAMLQAAHERMIQLLPAEAVARLDEARPEEAELIIAQHLNMLLARAPELFPRMDLIVIEEDSGPPLSDDWSEVWDDESDPVAADDDDDDLEDFEELIEDADSTAALNQSSDLIAQFYDYLLEMGKSSITARARSRALLVYAEFLASYYGRSLAQGDYASLDECLFFFYPRRVLKTSARQVRDLCTAIKQFYAFLIQRGVIDDDRFAEALWRRRDQAARVVEIYDRIAGDSPSFELLFERLFLPYTE